MDASPTRFATPRPVADGRIVTFAKATRIESARGSQPDDGAATSGPPGTETVPMLWTMREGLRTRDWRASSCVGPWFGVPSRAP
jgi:hypothetical protein